MDVEKRNAAEAAHSIIGIGSGSTVIHVVNEFARLDNKGLIFIPTSFQARDLLVSNNLKVGDLVQYPNIDITFDGADEIVLNNNILIKGGGGALLMEKIIAYSSEELIIVADSSKLSNRIFERWKKGLPIEVHTKAQSVVSNKLIKLLPKCSAIVRQAVHKAGPIITDNGNIIIDLHINEDNIDVVKLNQEISKIPGVIETGLFIGMASKIFIAEETKIITKEY
ncbi:ribose 5-phosphate isomerase [Rozella allomycis CSF55]|uniref:Ribose-5-phosphate isomerase n=1 Tax=Rozella allomycis (strain CSF55) TaxID=988480 RepID=A0A075ASU3_ROZAC|nr:Ribose 5-phosphate isomerase, type A domain-containing protein [Rozella allomycis CSF55]RKP18545.1 ribose 5-phosphate isomerase [Rozella allomycis CSF55]|eukprot:EPZ33338.1 Ribose 5-phosphate isomerase, type A domain-containing protein [Rozella allomycis CSF55]